MRCLASFVRERLEPFRAIPGPPAAPSLHTPPSGAPAPRSEHLADALKHLDADDYSTWIEVGQALVCAEDGKPLWLDWSAQSGKFDLREAEAKWATFSGDHTGPAAIFAKAQRNGWNNPGIHYARGIEVTDSVRAYSEAFKARCLASAIAPTPLASAAAVGGVATPVPLVSPAAPPGISPEEWNTAKASPDQIVSNLYHKDVGVFLSAGGSGKTTVMLHILICIVLGKPVFGMNVMNAGPVVFITGEDSRETLVARIRGIASAMKLTPDEVIAVSNGIRISDESGSGFKLTEVQRDVVRPTVGVDHMIASLIDLEPVLVVFDPAISFGVGESRINDAEQGLIEVGRRLRNALNCCVLYIHHIGKVNAREQMWDQYAGRGGSTFADGARMVHVMHPLTPAEFYKATGVELAPGETGLGFARPKMTFCPAQPKIYIKRDGYKFEKVEHRTVDLAAKVEGHSTQILDILNKDLAADKKHSRNSLESLDHGIPRADLRKAITWLIEAGRLEEQMLDKGGRGGLSKYLRPIASPSQPGEPMPAGGDIASLFNA